MPSVAVDLTGARSSLALSFLAFMTTVLLPMGFLSCRRCACVGCTDDLVECLNRGLYMFALKNERGKKTKNGIAGAIDDDAALHKLRNNTLSQLCGIKLETKHQADSTDIDDTV